MNVAQSIATSAAQLLRTHGHAPAKDILDLVMRGTEGAELDFTDPMVEHGSHAWPTSPLGQLIVEGFDHGMHHTDWFLVDRCGDPRVITSLMDIWQGEVLPKFAGAFRLGSLKA